MLENQSLEGLKNYDVPPYKEPKLKLVAIIISFFYLVFICLPLFITLYCSIEIFFFIRDTNRFFKKTIKYAKTKLKPKSLKSLP